MGRNIVITGASSLIGQAIADRLIEPGDRVLLQCRRNSDACRHLIAKTSGTGRVICADFTCRRIWTVFARRSKRWMYS